MEYEQFYLSLQSQNESEGVLQNGVIAQLVEQRTENPCVPGSIPGDTTKDKTLKIRLLISLQTVKVQHKTLKKSDVLHFFVSDCTKLHHFACKIPASNGNDKTLS